MKYHIRIQGELGQEWADWFGSPAVSREGDGVTLLTCRVTDQAALHGVLRKLRDLGLPLLSINRLEEKEKMLKKGSIVLSIWCGINIFLASLILTIVVFHFGNSPLLAMVFEKAEIAKIDARLISALNCLTILYNSCDVAVSVLALFIIWSGLIDRKRWAFWALLATIGFLEILAFIASAEVGNVWLRWQVNVVQSALYAAGIGLAGYSLFFRFGKARPVITSARDSG
jgi:hypothetical protein